MNSFATKILVQMLNGLFYILSPSFLEDLPEDTPIDRSYNGLECILYKYVHYTVNKISDSAADYGVTVSDIEERIKTILRRHRLIPCGSLQRSGCLCYRIDTYEDYSFVQLTYKREASYYVGSEPVKYFATVWDRSRFGLHKASAAVIMNDMEELTERFVGEYLAVNKPDE